jgi:hypothetical protein
MKDKHRYLHPFTEVDDTDPVLSFGLRHSDKEDPRGLVELRMCALSAAIREKPQWYTKFRDVKIQDKWRVEIEQQQQGLHEGLQLTSKMVNVVPHVRC